MRGLKGGVRRSRGGLPDTQSIGRGDAVEVASLAEDQEGWSRRRPPHSHKTRQRGD